MQPRFPATDETIDTLRDTMQSALKALVKDAVREVLEEEAGDSPSVREVERQRSRRPRFGPLLLVLGVVIGYALATRPSTVTDAADYVKQRAPVGSDQGATDAEASRRERRADDHGDADVSDEGAPVEPDSPPSD